MVGKIACLTATAAIALLSTDVAMAAATAEKSYGLEEIVVTARKMKENLQTTPVAVTVVSSKTLDNLSITNIKEIENITPNLQATSGFSGSATAANFFIRGIGQEDFLSTTDPGVAVFVDGVYMARTVGSAIDTADIERIEVLKGPQGTLFGKNTIGGAINITTAKPDKELRGFVEGTVGNLGRFDGRFMANAPISDKFFVKITGVTRNNDGFDKRIVDGVMLGDDKTVGGSLQARWVPTEQLDIVLSTDFTHRRAHIAAQTNLAVGPGGLTDVYYFATGVDPLDFTPVSDPVHQSSSGVRPTDNLDVFGASLTVNYDFGDMALKSISAFRRMKADTGTDFDGTPLPINDQLVHQDEKQYSQEFQLSQQTQKVKWVLGAFYMHEKTNEQIENHFAVFYLPPPFGYSAPVGTGPTSVANLKTNNFALFGQGSYYLTEKLSLTAGLRWTVEKKNILIVTPFGLGSEPIHAPGDHTWRNLSPKFGIEYQASDDFMVYASVTRGFKSGSYNGRTDRSNDFFPYGPEKVWSYEAGFKSEFADKRIRLNAAAFYTKYQGLQLSVAATDSRGLPYFPVENAGNVDIKGLEVELQARPVEALNVFANIGLTDENWTYIKSGASVTKDSRLPFMSHFTGVIGGDYAVPVPSFGSLVLGANYSYRDAYFVSSDNSPYLKQGSFGLLDAHVAIEPENGTWQVRFWGKNLTNEKYMTWGQDLYSIGYGHLMAFFGRPREYGVTFRVNL